MSLTTWLLWLLGAFFAGAVPFAVILGRLHGVDIRKVGSGNPGATNLARALGKRWGVTCFVLDVLKGLVPTAAFGAALVATGAAGPAAAGRWVSIAVAAVAGHIFSPFLRCRGGKGVATGLGAALGMWPVVTLPAVAAFVVWFGVTRRTGYVGLASVVAAVLLPVMTVVSGFALRYRVGEVAVFAGLTAVIAALVVVRHRANLARLRAGTESKVSWGGRRSAGPSSAG